MVKLTEEDRAFWRAFNKDTKRIRYTKVAQLQRTVAFSKRVPEEIPLGMDPQVNSASFGIEKLHPRKAKKCLIEATFDLHGYTQLQAESGVYKFLYQSQKNGLQWVKIITGKSGVLFHLIPVILKNNAFLISGCVHARFNDGGMGALYVRIRKLS